MVQREMEDRPFRLSYYRSQSDLGRFRLARFGVFTYPVSRKIPQLPCFSCSPQLLGPSMQAWVRRAMDLGIIKEASNERICQRFSQLVSWRKREPWETVPIIADAPGRGGEVSWDVADRPGQIQTP